MTNEQESVEVRRFKATKIKAEQGDAKAQLYLGVMYSIGIGVPEDDVEAAKWYQKAAEQGDAKAQYMLGDMHYYDRGVPKDYTKAAKWFRKAADQGNAYAQYSLGWMYYKGEGVPEDDAEAVKWFRKAAAQGDAESQYMLGQMYWNGQGVPRDDLEALQWTQNAAEQGHTEARALLKRMHEFVVTEMEAEKGDAKALYNLGQMYIARDYHGEKGAPQDGEDGFFWILDAASEGYVEAQLWMAERAWDMEEYVIALEWTQKAAEGGHAGAQYDLAHKYYDGEVVLKNFIEAYAWFLVAKANGNEHADEKISDLEKRLTAEGIEKGQARAAELQGSFGAE